MVRKIITLEVCADSVHAALVAQTAGACRVELCRDLPVGGVTPSAGEIERARKQLSIGLNVLIRPRAGDFVYDSLEFDILKSDISYCGRLGCDGVVAGILHRDGSIDRERNRELVELARAYSMSITFHRAFDECDNPERALDEIVALGFDRLLTSGCKPSALEGVDTLRRLIERAGDRIIIMPGAGVTPGNAAAIISATGCSELHGSFQGSEEKIEQVLHIIENTPR